MRIVADLHTHTISSGHAYATLLDYVAEAKKIGLKAFAIADHGPAMPGGPHYYHFSNMKMVPEKINGIRVYRGSEVNLISSDGSIDLEKPELEVLELVILGMHPRCGYEDAGEKENLKAVENAFKKNPKINILAHPGNRKYPLDPKETVSLCKKYGVVVEINNSSPTSRPGSWEVCLEFAKEVKKQDWKVALNTDSHFIHMLGRVENSLELIEKAGLSEKHVVNTSFAKIDQYLLCRKKSR